MLSQKDLKDLEEYVRSDCFMEGRFEISDGGFVESYINMFPITIQYEKSRLVSWLLNGIIMDNNWLPDILFGKELHGSLIASNLVRDCRPLHDLGIIRKSDELIYNRACAIPNAILLDDVISTGVNMRNSIQLLRDNDFWVEGVVCVVYRGGGAKEECEDMGIPLESILEIPEVITYD